MPSMFSNRKRTWGTYLRARRLSSQFAIRKREVHECSPLCRRVAWDPAIMKITTRVRWVLYAIEYYLEYAFALENLLDRLANRCVQKRNSRSLHELQAGEYGGKLNIRKPQKAIMTMIVARLTWSKAFEARVLPRNKVAGSDSALSACVAAMDSSSTSLLSA